MIEGARLLLTGLGVTVGLLLGGAVVATALALAAGLGRLSRDPVVRGVATAYVEVFRGTSALVQLFWFYYALPLLLGIELPGLAAGILVLGLNIGAYGGEVVRGALEAVPDGLDEAAVSLGLTRAQRLWHVVLPAAWPAILPPAGNLVVELLKATALVSMVTVPDLTFAADRIRADTLATGAVYALVLAIYWLLSQMLGAGVGILERRAAAAHGRVHP